jgi:Tfp pilus assembly protein PilF
MRRSRRCHYASSTKILRLEHEDKVMTMTTQHRRVAWLLVLILTVPGLVSAVRLGRLIGRVVDPEGSPIPGVRVTTTCAEIPQLKDVTTTSDKGIFKVDFERIDVVYRYEFEKAGHVTLKIEQKWTLEGTERHEFKMYPAETPTVDGRPPASTSNAAILAFNRGVIAFKAKDYPTARAKLEEALEYDPYLRQAWAALSQVYVGQKRYREAAEAADKAIALGSTDESVLRSRWEAYRGLGDEAKAAKAREDLERFGRLSEEAKRIHNEGVALSKAGDDAGAFAKFKDALALDPSFQPALLGLATTGLKIDRAAEAAAAAETILKADPQNQQAIRIRYNASLKLADTEMIVDALVGLAAVDPVVARAGLFKLATAAYDSDDTVNAKKRFGKVLELDPNHPRSHYFLGLILMREGAKQEAKSHLERFLALAPDDPDAATARDALRYLGSSTSLD